MTTAPTAALLPRAWVNEARAGELLRAAEVLSGIAADAALPATVRDAAAATEPTILEVAASLAEQAAADAALGMVPGA